MPQNDENVPLSNYTLIKLIRIGISPICAMIGTSAYYGQYLKDPILGSINSLLFGKKLGLDIWNLNQRPNTKTKFINSSKKILLGLGTIGLSNYAKFIEKGEPDIDPFPPDLLFKINNNNNNLMDWDTYISLNTYGISNLISGLSELIPNRFESIRKICNMGTGGCLISSGVAMGINNDFNNAYAIPTIVAGVSEIIHNLLPMETTHNEEIQETPFNDERARLINETIENDRRLLRTWNSNYGSIASDISEVVFDRDNTSLNWDYNHMSI